MLPTTLRRLTRGLLVAAAGAQARKGMARLALGAG